MEIDRSTIKALDSDTRIQILKSLAERRKMPTELSKELAMATSTITDHLKHLEEAGLIERKETGHKWIYYELTFKGKSLIKPKIPIQFIVMLSLGIILMLGSFLNISYTYDYEFTYPIKTITETITKTITQDFTQPRTMSSIAGVPTTENTTTETSESTDYQAGSIQVAAINWVAVAIFLIGSGLVFFSIPNLYIKRHTK